MKKEPSPDGSFYIRKKYSGETPFYKKGISPDPFLKNF